MDVLERPRVRRKRRFEKRARSEIRPKKPSERIDRILLLLLEYRFLRRDHIEDQLFVEKGYSKQTTGRLLSYLYDIGMVDMPEEQKLHPRPKGGGSNRDIFALGNRGAEYLEDEFNVPQSRTRFRDKNREVKHRHIQHTLLISEIMLSFERACALRKDVRLIYPREILELSPERTQAQRRPFQWQVETQWEKTTLRVPVAPDKVFGLEFTQVSERNMLWFMLEADTGSETVRPLNLTKASKPNLFHKFLGYGATYQAKLHRERFGVVHSFRVITVTARNGVQVSHDPNTGTLVRRTRIESMQEAARLAGGETVRRNPGFFLFADLATLRRADDVLTMPWKTAQPAKTAVLELKPA